MSGVLGLPDSGSRRGDASGQRRAWRLAAVCTQGHVSAAMLRVGQAALRASSRRLVSPARVQRMASDASSAGAAGGAAPKQGFFQSDSYIKAVGTVGALANWGIPLAGITHILENKDPKNTIDPTMTSGSCAQRFSPRIVCAQSR